MIYHIMTTQEWEKQKLADSITAHSLRTEGFIHCCYEKQIQGVLERYYSDEKQIIQLTIDETHLTVPMREEMGSIGEKFPHVLGEITFKAITEIRKKSTGMVDG